MADQSRMTLRFFDGHNDSLLRLTRSGAERPEARFLGGDTTGHIDLPRARRGGMAGGFFALFAMSPGGIDFSAFRDDRYELPLPDPLDRHDAWDQVTRQIVVMNRLVAASEGAVRLCTKAAELEALRGGDGLGIVLHMEGAEPIGADLAMLEVLHSLGLRSLGPVWSRPTIFGHGVPLAFPASPDIGPGLTDAGRDLVRACDRLGIMIDLSHLNAAGFRDVARISRRPLVATHSNLHALCPSARNLVDWQLDAIRDTGGMVGVNLATAFLRPDGQMRRHTDISVVADHVLGLVERLGEDKVGLGSDFDGALIPSDIADVAGTPGLWDTLAARGVDAALMDKLAWGNWMRIIAGTIG